jgi:hypothetical protein
MYRVVSILLKREHPHSVLVYQNQEQHLVKHLLDSETHNILTPTLLRGHFRDSWRHPVGTVFNSVWKLTTSN